MCHELFTQFIQYEQRFPGETPWQTFKRVLDANRGKGNITARQWGEALEEIRDEMFRLVAQGLKQLSDLPSVKTLRNATKGRGIGEGPDARHVHHIVEGRYQGRLGIPKALYDDAPGFVIKGTEHTPSPGSLAHRLNEVIGEAADADTIIAGHRQVYREKGFYDLWTVTEKWFISKGHTIPPE